MQAVFKKELRSYFSTPTGYIFMGFFLLLSGVFFATINLLPASPRYINVLGSITFIFMIVVPVLTMKLMADEARQKTDQLLLTAPLSVAAIVAGKYFAAVAVFLFTLLITCIYPVILNFFGYIAVWEIVGGYIGFFLLGCAFIAVGLFLSSLTDNQVIAAVTTFSVLLLLWVLDWLASMLPTDSTAGLVFAGLLVLLVAFLIYQNTKNLLVGIAAAVTGGAVITVIYLVNSGLFSGFIIKFFDWFSLLKRFEQFSMGILSLSPVVYYLSFSFAFLFLTTRVIEKKRWS